MRWAGHEARVGEEIKLYRVLMENPKEAHHLKHQGIDGRMGLEWISGRLSGGGVWRGVTWPRIRTGGGLW
jgi:hypothetical protein